PSLLIAPSFFPTRRSSDLRLEYITITDVTMTGDLHDASVFYTVRGENVGDEPDLEAAAEALHRARGQLRKIVGEQLGVRFTPTLDRKSTRLNSSHVSISYA